MRFCSDLGIINPTVGTKGTYIFRTNDIFDPNFTATGHQPYGHDTLALVYTKYKVLSSKITVHFAATGIGNSHNGIASIQVKTTSTAEPNPTLTCEQPETTYKAIGPEDSNKGLVTLSKTFNTNRFFGRSDVQGRNLSAAFGVSPVTQAFYHVGLQHQNALGDYPSTNFFTTITYKVLCTEPKDLGQS